MSKMKLHVSLFPYIDSADLFEQVVEQPWAIFLDSGVVNQKRLVNKHADFDVLAVKPDCTLVFENGQTFFSSQSKLKQTLPGDPIKLLQDLLPSVDKAGLDLTLRQFAYIPGALGYFSYDLARQYESLPEIAIDDESLPEMAVGIYHVVVVVDHKAKRTYLLSLGDSQCVTSLVGFWTDLIQKSISAHNKQEVTQSPSSSRKLGRHLADFGFDENLDLDQYSSCFTKVRNYTYDGDCYQVNLAKRFTAKVSGSSWASYCYLRSLSPAPYGAFMKLPFADILSNSPESFIQSINGDVITSPIKGTRARNHGDAVKDQKVAQELFNSEKDRAENLMIVDLMRNDLSRCCELGSVKVPKLFAVYSFANVHHLISTVTGRLKKGMHSLDLLRSCFPGGSITGAPKIRAMEIIEELEPHRRGLYCGSIGYVGVDGDLQTNIAIRTIVIKGGVARFAAGGGLVIDSDLEQEYQEIIDKARMMSEALSPKR